MVVIVVVTSVGFQIGDASPVVTTDQVRRLPNLWQFLAADEPSPRCNGKLGLVILDLALGCAILLITQHWQALGIELRRFSHLVAATTANGLPMKLLIDAFLDVVVHK